MTNILWYVGLGLFVFGALGLAYVVVTGLVQNWKPWI